uniref:Cadherin domain protein n=1 Tax=Macrostomum lignano TaxID=282301 RepID=A0A1I8FWY8_9PLAT
ERLGQRRVQQAADVQHHQLRLPAPSARPFAIHPRSGEIRLTSALDAETQQRYEIYVSVTDNHPPSPRTSVSIVKVLVTDVNDNAPQIVVNRDSLTVRENSQPISTVDYISVKDRDVGNRQTDAFSLTRMSGSDAVSGSGSQVLLLLQAIRSLDREQQAAHALSLTCSDSDGVASTENFTVSVGDVNDSPPVFPRPELVARLLPPLRENSPPGTVIGRLAATDADEPQNARTVYSVAGNCQHDIGIGELNATVYAKVTFDRETNASIRCELRATDAENPALKSHVEVVIVIADENDNAPTFPGNYTFRVNESRTKGHLIGRVEAKDLDEGDNGRWCTPCAPDTLWAAGRTIAVSPDGRIFLAESILDRERQAAHILQVEAQDFGRPRQTSVVWIRIVVLDENDNAPRFVFPGAGSDGDTSLNVSISDRPGDTVAKLTAVDDDEGANGVVTFFVDASSDAMPQCEAGLFRLDPEQGHVTLSGPIKRAWLGTECLLALEARDGGGKASKQRLRIRFVSDLRHRLDGGNGGSGDANNWRGKDGPPEMIIVTVCVLLAFLVLLCLVLLAAYFCYYMQPARAARSASARVPNGANGQRKAAHTTDNGSIPH